MTTPKGSNIAARGETPGRGGNSRIIEPVKSEGTPAATCRTVRARLWKRRRGRDTRCPGVSRRAIVYDPFRVAVRPTTPRNATCGSAGSVKKNRNVAVFFGDGSRCPVTPRRDDFPRSGIRKNSGFPAVPELSPVPLRGGEAQGRSSTDGPRNADLPKHLPKVRPLAESEV